MLDDLDGAVVVAMAVMRVMQAAVDEVADVIAMGHGFMATSGSVHVIGIMAKMV